MRPTRITVTLKGTPLIGASITAGTILPNALTTDITGTVIFIADPTYTPAMQDISITTDEDVNNKTYTLSKIILGQNDNFVNLDSLDRLE